MLFVAQFEKKLQAKSEGLLAPTLVQSLLLWGFHSDSKQPTRKALAAVMQNQKRPAGPSNPINIDAKIGPAHPPTENINSTAALAERRRSEEIQSLTKATDTGYTVKTVAAKKQTSQRSTVPSGPDTRIRHRPPISRHEPASTLRRSM